MRCGVGVVAVGMLLAVGAAGCDRAYAEQSAAGDPAATEEHVDHFLLFSGVDLWNSGGSLHGGMLWSPGGLLQEGFTFKVLVAAGQYRYTSAGTAVTGRYELTSAMVGWRMKWDGAEVTLFAGPDYQSHRLTPDDLGNRLRGSRIGARLGADVWYQPSAAFMATTSISVSTIGPNYWSRAAIGWQPFGWAWVGPELIGLGGDRYQQIRAGLHVTALRTGAFEWSAGLGYLRDSERRDGGYIHFGVLTRR